MLRRLAQRLNHEYWPWQLIYLPALPLYLWQALRQRSAAFFTNVNPAIDMGGFFGERKSLIYPLLPDHSYPSTILVPAGSTADAVSALWLASGIKLPLIIKPDVGERGDGIVKVKDEGTLLRLLADRTEDMLMQALIDAPCEYGLMFARDMSSGRTQLLSITGKEFLTARGDGMRSIRELLQHSWRGARQTARLEALNAEQLARIPDKGECVEVEPIGNHCRGTRFFDANRLATPELRRSVDELLRDARGINYGRLDVRSMSDDELGIGKFTVIELNGVSSEPGLIYDPEYSIWRCWHVLLQHLRYMGPISTAVQRDGHHPWTLRALVQRCEGHFGWRLKPLPRLLALFG